MIKIDQALVKAFQDANFGLSIIYENDTVVPSAGIPHVEIKVFVNDATTFSLNHSDETDGIFQAILKYPVDQPAIVAKQKANDIMSVFYIGRRITYEGQRLTLTRKGRMVGENRDGWYVIPIRVFFKAVLPRN